MLVQDTFHSGDIITSDYVWPEESPQIFIDLDSFSFWC